MAGDIRDLERLLNDQHARIGKLETLIRQHLGPTYGMSTSQIPHPQQATHLHSDYLQIADIDDTPVNGVVDAPISSNWAFDHGAAADPHSGYALDSDLTTHAGAADPHTGYRLESADHNHSATGLQGGTIAYADLTGEPITTLLATTVNTRYNSNSYAGTMFNFTLPQNALGTTKKLICELSGAILQNGTKSCDWRVQVGGVTWFEDNLPVAILPNAAGYRYWFMRFWISSSTAANVHRLHGELMITNAVAAATGFGDFATAAPIVLPFGNGPTTPDFTTGDRIVDVDFKWSSTTGTASEDFFILGKHAWHIG